MTGVPAAAIRELAHAFGNAREPAALLDARDHRAPQRGRQRVRADQPRAARRRRRPLRRGAAAAARPEQRAGRRRHGRDPEQAARASRTSRTTRRARSSRPRGARRSRREPGLHLTGMFEAMEHGELTRASTSSARTRRSRRPTSSAPSGCSKGLDHLVVQDLFLTRTARARRRRAARLRRLGGVGGNGHLERAARAARAQGARPARRGARRHRDRLRARRGASAHDLGSPHAEDIWNELRSLSPMHAGMSYARLEELGGIQWPCWDEEHPRRAVHPRPALGRRRRRAGAVHGGRALAAGRRCSTTTSRCA